jgi:Rad3-related DNA helicase
MFTLGLLLMTPAVIASPLFKQCRSVIITSGTLSPLDSFRTEMGPGLTDRLGTEWEGRHVVNYEKQVGGLV